MRRCIGMFSPLDFLQWVVGEWLVADGLCTGTTSRATDGVRYTSSTYRRFRWPTDS